MIDRRGVLLGGLALAAAPATARPASPFVRVDGLRFRRGDATYPVIGANMWYAAYLGADRPYGDRARLGRELDRLRALGVNNVRILGASERSPLKGAVSPTFRGPGVDYDPGLLGGLDRALAEIGRRGMTAVIYLNNFWEWSGGMAAYLTYVNGGRYVEAVDPARPWTDFPDFVAGFYGDKRAVGLANDYIRALVTRTNSVTGRRYADDPAITAWQLANEPRPAGTQAVYDRVYPAFLAWIRGNARLVKSLAPNHLVSTGSEGTIGCFQREDCAVAINATPDIDYVTAHIWPANWGWAKRDDLAGTYNAGAAKTRGYIDTHVALAKRLKKPLVIEEFGFPRDGGGFAPGGPTTFRDRYYRLIFDAVAAGARSGGPLAGANFWAWNGEGRARHADYRFRPGDTAYLGDPSHEPQGFYGVFDADRSTQAIIRDWARAMRRAA
ncbi:MAG: GH5_7 / GH5 / GH5_41 [uncultured Sphingomonadaceae bacterium]|uniref:mannan endo-1,4-beta-mannosidase n=1 Tax=uncultured Sphingomonadaceae bacterium TaxID=169976 RepID=A0A6J4RXK0_9SPHN|nr:MAG: GH5_7 / GH5 / GH5_41 [uncultured Sphingomonadaceae bacterium]